MTISLAIDTSTARTSVALVEDGRVLAEEHHLDSIAHGEVLPLMVQRLLTITNTIHEVVIGMGPGPFTGLRVGIAFGQSFAFARDIPWRGVCSLDSIASQVDKKDFIVATDARRKEYFWAHYREGKRIGDPQVALIKVVESFLTEVIKEGDVYPSASHLVLSDISHENVREPLYVRRPDAYPAPEGIVFRAMNEMDLVTVSALESVIYKGEDPWTRSMFQEELGQRDRQYLVAESNGNVIGYCGVMVAGDIADILTITVDGNFRRRGIGREFLKRMIDWSRNKKVEAIMLEVRIGNEEATPLYTSNGFYPLNVRKDYYGPGLDARVMRKDLR